MPQYNDKPFYKFPATNPRDPQPTEMEMLFDSPLEKEGQYGPYYIYKVRIHGEEESIAASPGLHKAIEGAFYKKGDVLSVIRTGEGKDTRYDILNTKDSALDNDTQKPAPPPHKPQEPRQAAPARPASPDARSNFIAALNQYSVAWDMAERMINHKESTADTNAVAFTIYRMAKDAGYDLREEKKESEPEPDESRLDIEDFPEGSPF
jgi:hypothetical protein